MSILFWVGLLIVVVTHAYMLVYGMSVAHSIVNLAAAGMILYGTWVV